MKGDLGRRRGWPVDRRCRTAPDRRRPRRRRLRPLPRASATAGSPPARVPTWRARAPRRRGPPGREAGREGEPHIMALAYFSLGERAEEDVRENLMHYYAWLGEDVAGMIVDNAAKDADAVKRYLAAYEEARLRRAGLLPQLRRPAPGRPPGRRRRSLVRSMRCQLTTPRRGTCAAPPRRRSVLPPQPRR